MRTERQSIDCICPKHMEALGKIAAQEDEIVRLRARISRLEARLKVEVRNAREAPFGENTPSSKLNFKKDSDEAARVRQGGAKPGHDGHGRKRVAPEEADETREAPAPSVCPDCGRPLLRVAPESREVRDIPPPRFRTVRWTVGRGFCPHCRKAFSGTVTGVLPRFAATNRAIAQNAADRYLHRMTVGTISRRTGMNASTIIKEDEALADILRPCVHRLRREYLEADTKHADETGWPCNGAHGQYAYGFFTEDIALYRFRKTRKGEVAAGVFGAREPHGVLVTDRYTGYDRPWSGDRQYCYAHILRKLLQLLKKEPDNKEYQAFVPPMAEQLRAAMALRSKDLPPEGFAREAEAIKSKIVGLANRSAKDPALQNVQNIFREHADRMYHWARGPDIPADNNRAERGVRGLVIARKTSFGGQSEGALWVREFNQSVMETLAMRCADPAGKLAKALDIYAATGNKSDVREFLFPKSRTGRLDRAEPLCQPSEVLHPAVQGCTEKFMQAPLIFRLLFTYAYTIIYAMQNKNSKKARSRAEILAEIAALPPSIQGTISSYRCPRKNGPPAVYHNFQYTLKGKNHSMTIPVGMVDDFKAAVASGKKLKDLVLELSATDAKALAEQASALKKNSHTSS